MHPNILNQFSRGDKPRTKKFQRKEVKAMSDNMKDRMVKLAGKIKSVEKKAALFYVGDLLGYTLDDILENMHPQHRAIYERNIKREGLDKVGVENVEGMEKKIDLAQQSQRGRIMHCTCGAEVKIGNNICEECGKPHGYDVE